LLKHLRGLSVYENSLKQLSKEHSDLFIRFVNMILNDSHFLLDEVLTKLPIIRETELEMKDTPRWTSQDEPTRQEREENLRQTCSSVQSFTSLAIETINLLLFLTGSLVEAFMNESLVSRVAEMLNYYLNNLIGPKSLNLKVENPERFNFDPKLLLSVIIQIYNNCSSQKKFLEAVVEDGRSFNSEVFGKALNIVDQRKIVRMDALERFKQFIINAQAVSKDTKKEEEDLGEIPDDFQDPITTGLMKDPVILPTSGKVVDRSVIARILLSDPKDPFNRQPLTIEMVKPNEELRKQIEKWREDQRTKQKK